VAILTGHGAAVPVEEDIRRPTIGRLITTIRQALIPGRPTQRHVEWAIRIFVILAIVVGILILLVRIGLVSSEDVTLVAALITLNGVILTQVVNARIAEFNQRQQQEVETNRAQAERSRAYVENMENLLVDHQLRLSNKHDKLPGGGVDLSKQIYNEARVVAQAQTRAVLESVTHPTLNRILLLFLYEAGLIDDPPVISLFAANLSGADLSNVDLSGADLSGADLTDVDLSNADLTAAKVTQKELDQAKSLANATMPNGQKYEEWLKSMDRGE
jgi:Pentapeptide repeats (8 copies)